MRKGVSGKIMTVIIALVMALLALIAIWYFLGKSVPFISQAVDNIINGIICTFCNKILGMWKGAVQLVGFCGGC